MKALRLPGMLAVSLLPLLTGAAEPAPAADSIPIPAGWFVWPYAEPQPGSALDTSSLNHKPAGSRGRVVVRDGVFVTSDDGARIRFWGCNLSSNEAFVDAATADRLARRLAMGGINIARLHHLDNPWSVDSGGSLWKPGSQDRIAIDPAQLDKLHRVVAALKAEGIYSNVNLKVSRTHTEADGFPPSIAQTPPFQKRVDYFSRRIIDLQKDYARQLLAAKNPYTGLSLAEDPAVAVVEINNENSLLGLRSREVGAGLHEQPEPFRGELTALWNAWLAKGFPDDESIRLTWAGQATPPGESPLSPGSRWHPDAQPGNEVEVESAAPGEVRLNVKPGGDGVRWRSAAFLDQLRFVDDATYTLTFAARADAVRTAEVTVSRDEPGWRTDKWRTRGLRTTIALAPEWQEFRFAFVTHSIIDVASRLSILAGHQPGEIWIKDLRLESGSATAGLQPGQSARAGTIPIPTDPTPTQWATWLQFLSETEQAYVAEMRACLRDGLKVQAPIVCTQMNYGGIAGLAREQTSDFIDAHTYWQHPDWGNPTSSWDTARYTIINTPQISEFGPRWAGELGALALLRMTGKPFTVSEVDHPAPSDYACEMYPVLATFAGLQDWDGLYPFDMVAGGADPDDGSIRTFFDQMHHPAKWGFGPFATRVFREGLVTPPDASRELFVSRRLFREANHLDVLWLEQQTGRDLGFLTDRLRVNENLAEWTRVERRPGRERGEVRVEQTKRGPVYLVSTPPASAIVGCVGGSMVDAGNIAVSCDSFGLNFAAVTAIALDGQPMGGSGRVLVTLAARAGNQGTTWNAVRTSVGDAWGEGGPPIAERVPATVRVSVPERSRVFALAPDGSVAAEIPATWEFGRLSFSTREGPATLHYEIRAR
jgi:hypothetical protein